METARCTRCGSRERSAGYGLCAHCLLTAALQTAELPVDDRFGNYEPVAVLGEGGMGIIYLAEQTAPLRRTVALKVLKQDGNGKSAAERFERERQSLACLGHPNIPAIYDAGVSERGVPFFVMEYVEGSPLTVWCDQHRLRIRERLQLFCQICEAVEHAHRHGVLHRDLKPANLLVTGANGQPCVKVIDFGLARLQDWHTFARDQISGYAQIAGTPEYMSPEQAAAPESAVGPHTDVYSLGIVLYELLSGLLPFESSAWGQRSAGEILKLICDTDLPPAARRFRREGPHAAEIARARNTELRQLAASLAGDLAVILRKATEKLPADRYRSPGALAADIQRYLRHEPLEARQGDTGHRVSKWARRHRHALAGAALVCAIVTVAAAVSIAKRPTPRLAVEHLIPFTAFEGQESSPSFSPDGHSIVFSWNGPERENFDLYLADSPGAPPRRLTTSPAADVSPAWSPDGKTIAFLRGSKPLDCELMLLDLATGQETALRTLRVWYSHQTRNLDWTPDGKWIVFLNNDRNGRSAPKLFSPATGEFRPMLPAADKAEFLQPAMSPDGRSLAYLYDDLQFQTIRVQPLSADYQPVGAARTISNGRSPTWLPNGDLLFQTWARGRPRIARWSAASGVLDTVDELDDRMVEVAASRQGNRIALGISKFNSDIWNFHLNGTERLQSRVPVAASNSDESDIELSPDGRTLAFVSSRSGRRQVWLATLDGSAPRQVTFGDSVRRGPNWLPDGRTLRFGTRNEEVRKFWRLDTVTGKVEFERDDVYIEHAPPDGKWIFYRRAVGDQNRLFRSPADNPKAAQSVVAKRQCFGSVVDPSGKWIYFNDLPSGSSTLWRIPTDGSPTDERVVEAVQARAFAVSKSGIYFARQLSSSRWGLYFQPHGEKAETLLAEINRRPTGRISVSPDERELVLEVAVQEGNDILLATLVER
ncbi:MAG: serine/threonine-protein kinase [Bryobacterales bacterium]|nr:serine/threonine-protein kinase [Bryobacterales bacterium]